MSKEDNNDNKKASESRDMMTECDLISEMKLSPHKNGDLQENNEQEELVVISRYG